MIDACDATIAYRTNPHLDQRDRGIEAATILSRTLRGEIKLAQAVALPPIAINIERQLTDASPSRELMQFVDEIRHRPGVLSASAVLGFPYADVAEMGSSFIVVTENNPQLAKTLANEIADYVIQRRESFNAEFISIDNAIDDAVQRPGPVCLLDIGDNVGGGSPGDGTALAHALISRSGVRSFVCINDPAAIEIAHRRSPGESIPLQLGGTLDTLQGPPLSGTFRICSFHTGQFTEPAPRHGGKTNYDMGPSVIVESESGLTILLTSRRTPPFSLNQLLSCDIDPAGFQILVAKGVHAPVAAYAPVCKSFIRVNTPGLTTADMTKLPYRHRRHPLFPLDRLIV
jgi:microcystin degradation protein MlrC